MTLPRICLLMIAMMMVASPARAAAGRTWFVSPGGSDENPGTVAEPFLTIGRAAEAAGPGDTVRAAAGMYNEAVVFPRSGEAGAPIIFEGERGPAGEWLTVLDRSTPATGWEPAPEVGEGVFKAELGFNPGCITRDGKMLARIFDRNMTLPRDDRLNGINLLTMPADEPLKGSERIPGYLVTYPSLVADEHGYWDGLEAIYGFREGITYLRFRNGDDPRELELLAAPDGGGFVIRDRAHLVIRDFAVRGAQVCVEISGREAVGNIVEGNYLTHGRARVTVTGGAARNIIRGNEMTLNYYGHDRPGPWGTASPDMETSLAGYVYLFFKHVIGNHGSDDNGVLIDSEGEANEVVGNRIRAGLIGISARRAPGLRVHRNLVSHMSSIGIITSPVRGQGPLDAEFHDNFVYDCNINLRLHRYDESRPGERREYHYRNIYHQSGHAGGNIYVHWSRQAPMPETSGHPEFFLYHNTFSGGRSGVMSVSGWLTREGGMDRTRVINNLISSRARPWNMSREFYAERDMMDVFDYNWAGGTELHHDLEPAWLGGNNILAIGQPPWTDELWPDFRLPEGHAARNAGLDLSRPFSVQGREFPALPGMEPGYFEGERPDIGAIQHGRAILVPRP